ncbi:Serine protease, partial [Globisporangium splendens]
MVHSNSNVPMVSARGLSTQRQLDALNSAPKYFSKDQLRTANVSTGITIEYTLHGTSFKCGDGVDGVIPEDCVVLIMGFLQPKESWAAVIDFLLEKYENQSAEKKTNTKILAFDNRGTGGTSAPWWRYTTSQMAQDALALMDVVGWESANIVGISMGGMIALELASLAPQRVNSLSLLVTTRGKYVADARSNRQALISAYSTDPTGAVTNMLGRLYPLTVIRESRMVESYETVYDTLFNFHLAQRAVRVKPSLFALLGQYLAIKTHFISDERLAEIAKAGFPVLVLGGAKDTVIPPIESIKLQERMDPDHVHLQLFENSGHVLTIQFVNEVADAFIKTFERSTRERD